MKTEKKKKRAILIAVILLVIALVAVIVVLVILLLRKNELLEDGETPQGYVMDEENYQQIADEMEEKVKAGYFETYMNMEWTFADGTSETEDAILGNSPNNIKPIRCEVLLDDTGEKVFATDVLPVGAQVPPFKLDVDLDAGTYDATCMIYLMDEKDDGSYQDASSAGFRVTIIVEN